MDQGIQGLGQRADVTGRHEQAALLVLYHFRDAADARGDAGAAEAHGFEDAEAEALGVGGEEANVGGLEIVLDGVDFLADDDAVVQTEAPDFRGERREGLAGENEELEVSRGRTRATVSSRRSMRLTGRRLEEWTSSTSSPRPSSRRTAVGRAAGRAGREKVVDDLDRAVEVEQAPGFALRNSETAVTASDCASAWRMAGP